MNFSSTKKWWHKNGIYDKIYNLDIFVNILLKIWQFKKNCWMKTMWNELPRRFYIKFFPKWATRFLHKPRFWNTFAAECWPTRIPNSSFYSMRSFNKHFSRGTLIMLIIQRKLWPQARLTIYYHTKPKKKLNNLLIIYTKN